MPILTEEPGLRCGSFSGVLEEYVEAVLFFTWLHGQDDSGENTTRKPVGKILMPNELPLSVSVEEYLGGLCDLSGEIGRFAVASGTARDRDSVKLCLDTNKSMYMAMKMVGRLPGSTAKKVQALSRSVEKLERMMYELSLMEMTGRKSYASAVEDNSAVEENQTFGEDG